MIDFSLTEEQRALRDLARDFAQGEILPVREKYDRSGEFPWDIVRQAHEIGLMNIEVPEEYGGLGLGALESAIVAEEIAAVCGGMATIIMDNGLGLTPLLIAGNDEQKRRFLTPLTEKPILISYCLTEPEAGSDAGAVRTTAVRDGDEYLINGVKHFITNGGVATFHTVFTSTDRSKAHRGMTTIMVPADTPGVSVGKHEDKLGHRASDTSEVIFEDVRVPVANRLGNEGDGFKIAMMTLDRTRTGIAGVATGIARGALEAAVKFARERVQFGQPIANFQGIQWMLADMAIKVETARQMTWYAAWLVDQGQRSSYESAIAKCYASDIAMQVTTDAVQVMGGYGYMKEYPAEKYMRDAKLTQIYEGTNQIQRIVISRALLS